MFESQFLIRSDIFAERWLIVKVDPCRGSAQLFLLVDRVSAAVASAL